MEGVERTGEGKEMRNTLGKMRVSGGLTQTPGCRGLYLNPDQRDRMSMGGVVHKVARRVLTSVVVRV